jgi:hypothetical protein
VNRHPSKQETARRGVDEFAHELERLAPEHYKLTAGELLQRLDTDLGRLQYARLLGVVVKEPFAQSFKRRPSTATKARIGLKWRSNDELRAKGVQETWQFQLVREIVREETGQKVVSTEDTISFIEHQARYETELGKHLFRAFRKRICGSPEASKAVREAINQAKKKGVNLVAPTVAGISTGAASLVAIAIASLFSGPIAVAAAPVIGGITLLVLQVGVDGFCEWSREILETDKLRSAEEQTEDKA